MGKYKGALAYKTRDAAVMARRIVCDPEYLAALRARAIAGTLGPMEPVLWYYGFGKPKENVNLTVRNADGLADLTTEQLTERAAALVQGLRQLSEARPNPDVIDAIAVATVQVPNFAEEAEREALIRALAEEAGMAAQSSRGDDLPPKADDGEDA